MVIQEENNSVPLLPKPDHSVNYEESNTLINDHDSIKPQDYCKAYASNIFNNYNKDTRLLPHFNRLVHTIEIFYRKRGYPPHFCKKHVFSNVSYINGCEALH